MSGTPAGEWLIHKAFELQVRKTPNAIALIHGATEITYDELNRRANAIAWQLRAQGAGRGDLIGVYLRRTEWLVASLLGVLKAGGAYVPLDPAYPDERLALMAADAQLRHVVAGSAEPLPWHAGAVTIDAAAPGGSGADLEVQGRSDDAAYVIYTSGSTGRPKGVVMEHRNTRNLIQWVLRNYSQAELGGALFAGSMSFDFSITEVFPALLSGGTVVQVDNLLVLHEVPACARVSMICAVPSVMAALLQRPLPPSVRTVNLGGEAVSRTLVQRVFANPGVQRVLNLYGPTECTTYTTAHEITCEETGKVPLGRPIDGALITVRDPQGAEVAQGTVGELWVGGPVVARGYLRRPELTAAAFVDTPELGRVYRTGDLVSVEGGLVWYHGRVDHQVKIRGFRIELGEVEAALATHPLVRHAVVLATTDAQGAGTLVGFAECASHLDEQELRGHLSRRLPPHMVPGRIVVLDRIPVWPNGKADRDALAALPLPAPAIRDIVAPRSELEQQVWDISSTALGRSGFGVLDTFGELGGHSLTAARIAALARAAFNVPLSPLDILAKTTVAGLAGVISARVAAASSPPARDTPVRWTGRSTFPLTAAQREFWTIRTLYGPQATTVAVRMRITGLTDPALIQRALTGLVARHEVLRCAYTGTADGELTATVRPPSTVELTEVAIEDSAIDAVTRPFSLTGDEPALRAIVARGEEGLDLVVATDHLVFDGWSVGVLLRELATDLARALRGDPPAQATGQWQVGDLAVAEQPYRQSPDDVSYWCDLLDGAVAPHDLPGTPADGDPGLAGRYEQALSIRLGHSVAELASVLEVSAFTVYLGALAIVVSGLTGRGDTLLSAAYARRDEPGSEEVIGPLLGVLPIRCQVDPRRGFADLAREIAHATAAGLGHADLAFEQMVAKVARQAGAPALPVMLSLQPPGVPVRVAADAVLVELVGELRGGGNPHVLSFSVNDTAQGPTLAVEYPRHRFCSADAEALTARLVGVLQAVVADPGKAIGDIEPLVQDEPATRLDTGPAPTHLRANRIPAPLSTVMQEFVAGVWAEVLGVEQVYANDDFFALGGHSLSATRVTGRLRELLGSEIAVRILFDHPVLAHFASAIEQQLLDEEAMA